MSKSLGNGIDPLEVIATYGTDALRFSLVLNTSPGNDLVPKACSKWLERQTCLSPYNPGPPKGPVPAVSAVKGLPLNLYLS